MSEENFSMFFKKTFSFSEKMKVFWFISLTHPYPVCETQNKSVKNSKQMMMVLGRVRERTG